MNGEMPCALHHHQTTGTFSLLVAASGTACAPVFTIANICSWSRNSRMICVLKVHTHAHTQNKNECAHTLQTFRMSAGTHTNAQKTCSRTCYNKLYNNFCVFSNGVFLFKLQHTKTWTFVSFLQLTFRVGFGVLA